MNNNLNLGNIKPSDPENRKDVLRELQEVRTLCSKYETIIENAPDGLYITDGEANAICINPSFERISGLKRKDMIGVNHHDLEQNGVVARSSSLMAIKEKKTITIIHDYLKSGLQALVTSTPVVDEAGQIDMVVSSIRDITELAEVKKELEMEKERVCKTESRLKQMQVMLLDTPTMIAVDKQMKELLYKAARIAAVDSTVLITGETGVGKEVVAKFVHNNSLRKKKAFITVNCGAIPENLVESELFGYEKGAFTGANSAGKPGILEAAESGTVFLDEIGELPLDMQVKLLRALENHTITRVGGIKQIPIDIRVIAATNRNLREMARQGKFREDLYYRLNVVQLRIPPLRERRDDIIPLAKHFLDEVNEKYHMNRSISNTVYMILRNHDWGGNVRELKNFIESMVVSSDRECMTEDDVFAVRFSEVQKTMPGREMPFRERVERMEYIWLKEAYQEAGNVRDAAAMLQLPHATFVRKKKAYEEKYGGPNMDQTNENNGPV